MNIFKSYKKLAIIAVILIISSIGLYHSFNQNSQTNKLSNGLNDFETGNRFLMDTLVQMKVYGTNAQTIINKSFSRLEEIEKLMSKTITNSDISKINNNPGQAVTVNQDTFYVIKQAVKYAEISQGKFDFSIGSLVDLWGFGTSNQQVPTAKELKQARSNINYKSIKLNKNHQTVTITKPGIKLDLGGITKGYAADEVKKIVKNNSQNPNEFINMGGNVLGIGNKPDGSPWNIGIQDPRKHRGNVMASVKVTDKTIVTSGNYERYFEKNGTLYHHILNPDTGKPVRNKLRSVSIITDNSLKGDALSTSIFIFGVNKGLKFVEEQDNIEAIFITKDLKVILTSGLKNKVKLLNSDFKLVEGDDFENY